jgi:hypothetical protein
VLANRLVDYCILRSDQLATLCGAQFGGGRRRAGRLDCQHGGEHLVGLR